MSANSINVPFPIFNDVDGDPLDAGYIYIGTANLDPETNPISLFFDKELTIPAPQPVRTLNGFPSNSGTPARLYISESDYSITVKNKNSTLVYTSLIATDRFSSALIYYVQGGSNSISRTVENKLQELISVKDFGAVGDGVTDDTTAFKNAIDSTLGKSVLVPFSSLGYNVSTISTIGTAIDAGLSSNNEYSVPNQIFEGSVYSPMPSVNIHAKNYYQANVGANTEQSSVDYKTVSYSGDRFIDVYNTKATNTGSGEACIYTGLVTGNGTGNNIVFTGETKISSNTIPYAYVADFRINLDFPCTTRSSVVNAVTKGTVGADHVYYSSAIGVAPKHHFYTAGLAGSVADIYLTGNGNIRASLADGNVSIKDLYDQLQRTDVSGSASSGTINSNLISVSSVNERIVYELTLTQWASNYFSSKRYLICIGYNEDHSTNSGIQLIDTAIAGLGDLNRVSLGLTSTVTSSAKTLTYTFSAFINYKVDVKLISRTTTA